MNVSCIALGNIAANCYMISGENAAVVIDPGVYCTSVRSFLENNAGKSRMIILTHGHFDHIGGAARLRSETGVPITIGEKDAPALGDSSLNLSRLFGAETEPFAADRTVSDGEILQVGDLSFQIMCTPGHTVGGICLLSDDILISGDILFEGSVGRTDFPGGDTEEMMKSLERIIRLDGKTRVLPGHGRETTVEKERKYNPFIKGLL